MQAVKPASRDNWQELTIAKNQKQYLPIPANWHYPFTETKWRFSLWERIKLLFGGHIHIMFMTFGDPFSPMQISLKPQKTEVGCVNFEPSELCKTGSVHGSRTPGTDRQYIGKDNSIGDNATAKLHDLEVPSK